MLSAPSTHTRSDIDTWLAKQAGTMLHFTPSLGSWLEMVRSSSHHRLPRRPHVPSRDLIVAALRRLVEGSGERPFIWAKTAKEVVSTAARGASGEGLTLEVLQSFCAT